MSVKSPTPPQTDLRASGLPPPVQDELQALIQEARHRARHRRARYATVVAAVGLLATGLYAAFVQSTERPASHSEPRVIASADHGTLEGVLAVCCSAPPHEMTPVRGIVRLRQVGGLAQPLGRSRLITVNHTGHFSTTLPPGRYTAAGGIPSLHWKLGQCRPTRPTSAAAAGYPIALRPNTTTRVLILCAGW